MNPYNSFVVVTPATVLTGDVIQIGGTAFTVANMIVLEGGGKRLQFETGEAFTMRSRTTLKAFRPKGAW